MEVIKVEVEKLNNTTNAILDLLLVSESGMGRVGCFFEGGYF